MATQPAQAAAAAIGALDGGAPTGPNAPGAVTAISTSAPFLHTGVSFLRCACCVALTVDLWALWNRCLAAACLAMA